MSLEKALVIERKSAVLFVRSCSGTLCECASQLEVANVVLGVVVG